MRSITSVIVLLVAALVVATGLAWQQHRALIVLRAAGPGNGESEALAARLEEFKKRNYELQAALASLRAEKVAADPAAAGEPAPTPQPTSDEAATLNQIALLAGDGDLGSRRDEDLELLAAMADLPEFQKLMALQLRGKVDEKYAALFKRLKLAPEEMSRLRTLLADRQGAFADAMMAARAQGLTGKDARQVAGEVARATQKDVNSSIRELLGPQRFNQLQNYERTAPQRETVDQLAQRLSYTGTPLMPRQQDRLVQVLTNSGAPVTDANGVAQVNKKGVARTQPVAAVAALPGSVAGLGLNASNSVVISNSAVGTAQSFLSPQQVAALQRMQQEQQAQQTIGNLLRSGTVNAPVKNKPPKPPKN